MGRASCSHESPARKVYDEQHAAACLCTQPYYRAGNVQFKTDDPSAFLRQILVDYKSPRFEYLPSFTGGLVGYFAYDYQGYKEPAAKTAVQHRQYPIFGVQFHPESIMTPDGKTMLRNFINHKP